MQENKGILVVEDDPDIGKFLLQFFEEETPYYAFLATDAPQALAIVRSLVPDFLLVDYRLPDMNGLELYSRLQAIQKLRHTPVLFMTAYPHSLAKQQMPVLKKPFDLNDLLQTMETMWEDDIDWHD